MNIKTIIVATLMTLSGLTAFANNSPVIYMNDNIYDLSWISDSKVTLQVHYTGPISGICALRFDTSPYSSINIKDILSELNMHRLGEELTTSDLEGYPNALLADLIQDRYVDSIIVETKNGEPLSKLLKKLKTNVIVSTFKCANTSESNSLQMHS